LSEAPSANPSSDAERRTVSGERRIELPELKATRVSERFQIPEEAIPTTRPPAPSPHEHGDDARRATEQEVPSHKATRQMPVPESIKQLAVPTPPPFDPSAIEIPKASPLPTIAVPSADDRHDESDEAAAAAVAEAPPTARPRRHRELVGALVLLVLLLAFTLLAIRLVASVVFA